MRFPDITSPAWRRKKFGKLAYYGAGIARDLAPGFLLRARLEPILRRLEAQGIPEHIRSRVDYYNKFSGPIGLEGARKVRAMPLDKTYYYYDFRKISKYFGDDILASWLFGDIHWIPDVPTLVKSRPLGDNTNSIIMKLESFRHFQWPVDPVAFEDKQPRAVWRGDFNNPLRRTLVERFNGDPRHDIGHNTRKPDPIPAKPFVSMREQFEFRYILSVEGVDVATNLKWVMSSNSLCLMPRPTIETWYMEGTLQAGVHYVELRDDFADLDDKIAYYEAHPAEAKAIVAAANAYTLPFRNEADELIISLLVMQKYLELTGQVEPRFFAR